MHLKKESHHHPESINFLEYCSIIQNYDDLVKLVEMDLSLIKNPELKDIVENIRELVGNIDKLPELMHNILIYNSVINFATNYTNICYKIKNTHNQISGIENEIKGMETDKKSQKSLILNSLNRIQRLKHNAFGDNISQIKHSETLMNYNRNILQLKREKSIKDTVIDKLNTTKLTLKMSFESNFIKSTELVFDLEMLINSIENHVLLELSNRKINFDILKNMKKCEQHNLLNIKDLNTGYQPLFMNELVDSQPTLRDKAILANKQICYNNKINLKLNELNRHFVNNLELDYLDDENKFTVLKAGEKLCRNTKNKLISAVEKNLDFIKNNQTELIQGALIYIAGSAITSSIFFAADVDIQQNWQYLATSNFLLSGALETICNVRGLVYLASEVNKLAPQSLIKQFWKTTSETLDSVPQFEIKKDVIQTPNKSTEEFKNLEEPTNIERC